MKDSDLSADQILRTLQSLEDPGQDRSQRRVAPRIGMRARIVVYEYNDGNLGPPIDTWCRDVSTSGIGLVSRTPLQPGKRIAVQFRRAHGDPLPLLFRVTRCETLGSGLVVIGAALVGGENLASARSAPEHQPPPATATSTNCRTAGEEPPHLTGGRRQIA